MRSPYADGQAIQFWKTGVERWTPFSIEGLYQKKFEIGGLRVMTAGSCFAQHIATRLRQRDGFEVLDVEPPPPHLCPEHARQFGYSLYSARYGNIYLARQLLQLLLEAKGRFEPQEAIWEMNGRFFDALRPSVEPQGLSSAEEVKTHRRFHMEAVRRLIGMADLLVFTLGLTEGWVHRASGTVYPTAPGTVAGDYDSERFAFHNFTAAEIKQDLEQAIAVLREENPKLNVILTVSPVPLTATAEKKHVLVATTHSKATLRSVAGELSEADADIDYFPSFELIGTPFSRGMFYAPNLRSIEAAGVEAAMRIFFDQHKSQLKGAGSSEASTEPDKADHVICEEALLDAFA